MSIEHLPLTLPSGTRVQSGIPARAPANQPYRSLGLLVRGVVTATYVVDDPNHFQNDGRVETGALGVYCDVLTYSNHPKVQRRFLPRCLVLQDRGAIHSGRIWKPRAANFDLTGNGLNLDQATNLATVDGDHVLVGFLDDQFSQPIILGGVLHPSVDAGAEQSQERQRLQLKQVDGDPDFWKHHGAVYGVADNGDFRVDTRFANDGELQENGAEKDPSTDGSGAQRFDLPVDASQVVTFWDMGSPESPEAKLTVTTDKEKLRLEFVDSGFIFEVSDADTKITLGGDAEQAVVDSLLQGELARIKDDIDQLAHILGRHRHPVPEFPVPLLFGDIIETFVPPLVYLAKTNPPVNIRTGGEATPGPAPQDLDAGNGEFFGTDTGPSPADLIPGGTDPGATNSDTVVIKS